MFKIALAATLLATSVVSQRVHINGQPTNLILNGVYFASWSPFAPDEMVFLMPSLEAFQMDSANVPISPGITPAYDVVLGMQQWAFLGEPPGGQGWCESHLTLNYDWGGSWSPQRLAPGSTPGWTQMFSGYGSVIAAPQNNLSTFHLTTLEWDYSGVPYQQPCNVSRTGQWVAMRARVSIMPMR